MMLMRSCCLTLMVFTALSAKAAEPLPEWLWHQYKAGDKVLPGTETIYVRKAFSVEGPVTSAELKVCGDDEAKVFLNGQPAMVAGRKADPNSINYSATTTNVTARIVPGENVIAAQVRNGGGPFGIIARLEITLASGRKHTVISDSSWLTTTRSNANWETLSFRPADWTRARSIAKEGDNPWFEVMNPPTTAQKLELLPGFKAELLRQAKPGEGSWVAMAIDDKGRLIISPQKLASTNEGGMLRVTLNTEGRIVKEEKIELPVGASQGLCFANGALYVNGYAIKETPENHGIYRVTDSNGDDIYDHFEKLKTIYNRGGSHGPHGVVPGPDGFLYHISGDYSRPVDGTSGDSPHKNYQEDLLLPRHWDASGHAIGIVAPMGTVQRFDAAGSKWQLFAAGLRNPYDVAFNAEGEAFTYDADMEYDFGLPWYRPTRVYHLVSGGEYGHREGTGKWPYYYPDSLPPATDIGLGSPCGVQFGTGSRFPAKYQKALFMCDWAWGTVYAVHFKPFGASYTATHEKFATGRPLNAMDIEFGRDGAMYLITGGNDTQTGLYRISYEGPISEEPKKSRTELRAEAEAVQARALRRQLESLHGKQSPEAVGIAWPHLKSEDRFIRYAARIAIEWQPTNAWHSRALSEKNTRAALTVLLGVARTATTETKPALIRSLRAISWSRLNESQRLELLRVYGVTFARLGGPDHETRQALLDQFDSQFPANSEAMNRELCMLLVFLESPTVVRKSMRLISQEPSQEQQVHYIYYLRQMAAGWSPELRRAYFEWHQAAPGKFQGGVSFTKFLANFKKDAIAALTEAERKTLAPYLEDVPPAAKPTQVPRPFVKEWTLDAVLPDLEKVSSGRQFSRGKAAFEAAQCAACHRVRFDGGTVGPDLTAVGSRFSRRDILEAIIQPSKIVMEQYQNTTLVKKDGDDVSGRIIEEDDRKVVLITNPLTGDRAEVLKKEIQSRSVAKLSPMPEGLVNVLTKDEILDLIAYLESGGMPNYSAFK